MKTFLIVSGVLIVGYIVYSKLQPSTPVVQQPPSTVSTAIDNLLIRFGLGPPGKVAG